MNIHLTAIVKTKPGKAEEIKIHLYTLVGESTREEACLQYELYQSGEDENIFFFHETWADQPGLDAHNTSPHIRSFVEQATALMAEPLAVFVTKRLK